MHAGQPASAAPTQHNAIRFWPATQALGPHLPPTCEQLWHAWPFCNASSQVAPVLVLLLTVPQGQAAAWEAATALSLYQDGCAHGALRAKQRLGAAWRGAVGHPRTPARVEPSLAGIAVVLP